MSFQIPITPKELRTLSRMLAKPQDVHCLDEAVYVKTLLVARDRLYRGLTVKATIIKPKAVTYGNR